MSLCLAANLITATSSSTTFGGTIGGAISLYKAGSGTLALASANSFSGTTNVQGGALTLQDSGTLASTTINVNVATLTLNNQNVILNSSRIASAATVNLNSGSLNFNGAGDTIDSTSIATTVGVAVALNQGSSAISSVALVGAANNPGTAVLTIGNLTRSAGSAVTFSGSNLGQAAVVNNFGIGSSEILLNNVNGALVSLTHGIIGGWATVAPNILNGATTVGNPTITLNGETTASLVAGMPVSGVGIPANEFVVSIASASQFTITTGTGVMASGPGSITVGTADFAGYVAATGVGALNTPGYATYTSTNLNSAGSSDNVRINATPGANVATATINSLNISNPAAATTVTITSTSPVTIATGGLILSDSQGKNITFTRRRFDGWSYEFLRRALRIRRYQRWDRDSRQPDY